MAMAQMVLILVVVTVGVVLGGEVMISVPTLIVMMIMSMHASRNHIIARVAMQASDHGPGGLERHDEHQE